MYYLKIKEPIIIISFQNLILSFILENKEKKKIVLEQKKNSQKEIWLREKGRYNIKLKLLIKKEKKGKYTNIFLKIIKLKNMI